MYGIHIRNPRTEKEACALMDGVGCDPEGVWIMEPKLRSFTLSATGLHVAAANILKQEMLSAGGEAAIARGTVNCSVEKSDTILHGTLAQYRRLVDKLEIQPFGLREFALELHASLSYHENGPIPIETKMLRIPSNNPLIMGILNLTPDSFSDGGLFSEKEMALEHVQRMEDEGADIIDIGGESTRPGSVPVSAKEEWNRVKPVLEAVGKKDMTLSLDTSKGIVAKKGLEMGVEIINDVTAGSDPMLLEAVAEHDSALVLMHMQGNPTTMQQSPEYKDVVGEVCRFLENRVQKAIDYGVKKIILDPGIGFGKSVEHNLQLLCNLESIRSMGYPVLVGVSRKSLLGSLLDLNVNDELNPSLAALSAAVVNGADIVRVHDVKQSKQAAIISAAIRHGARP